jgi:hypothetical protein
MVVSTGLIAGLNYLIKEAGKPISVSYYLSTTGSIYDEADTLTKSGNTIWTSGIVFGLDPNSSEDNVLLEQGKIGIEDKRLYTQGDLMYSIRTGSVLQTKIGLGSPGTDFFSIIMNGADAEEANNVAVYKKAYIRRLTNGSLIGM